MEIAFLGTGAAFSLERYNGAVVVDRRLLLDGGAPLLPHLARLGIDPGAIEAIFLTHLHGDHILGLPTFMLHRAFIAPGRSLTIVCPAGAPEHLEKLFELCWHSEWRGFRERIGYVYDAGRPEGEAAGVRYQAVPLVHGRTPVRGYRLGLDGRVLAYAGDTQATPELDRLIEGADVVITEATGPGQEAVHTSWEQAEELTRRYPGTKFLFNHVYSGRTPGAVSDLDVVVA